MDNLFRLLLLELQLNLHPVCLGRLPVPIVLGPGVVLVILADEVVEVEAVDEGVLGVSAGVADQPRLQDPGHHLQPNQSSKCEFRRTSRLFKSLKVF